MGKGLAWVVGPGCRAASAAALTMLADGGAGAAGQMWLAAHAKLSCSALSLYPSLFANLALQ